MFDQQFFQNPHPVYAKLRQMAPVVPLPAYGMTLLAITRYDDCFQLLRDPRLSSVKIGGTKVLKQFDEEVQSDLAQFAAVTRKWMMFLDAPQHTVLRKVLYDKFAPAGAEKLRPAVHHAVLTLLDRVRSRETFDVIADFSQILPAMTVVHLLGLPASEAPLIGGWAEPIAMLGGALRSTPEMAKEAMTAVRESTDYLRQLLEQRRRKPGEDVISVLLAAQDDGISDDDVIAQALMIITAGHQTARDLIGNGIYTLLQHPDAKRQLQQDPSLIRTTVEEILRYEGPIQAVPRFAKEEVKVYEHTLAPTDTLVFVLGAANRDAAHFNNPESFDITRKDNSHLGFGAGAHACIGASIARIEAQASLAEILRYFPDLELATTDLQWRTNFAFRGLQALPVKTGALARASA